MRCLIDWSVCGVILASLAATAGATEPPTDVDLPAIADLWNEPAIEIGLAKQLLVDDYVISQKRNIQRDLNQVSKENGGKPLLVRDKPWEQANLFQVQSVLREDGKFVMHYGYVGPVDYTCRAVSNDGLKWTKEVLGLREFNGSKENNLLDYRGAVRFLDSHEDDPAHRFKSVYRPLESSGLPHAACLAYSADGLEWYSYHDGKPVTGRASDTLNQLAWDERAQVYRLFTRTDFGAGGGPREYRGAREMINPDVKANPANWKTVREWIFDREGPREVLRRQIHTVNFWQHEGIDFGFLSVMEWPAFNIPQVDVGDDATRHERDVWNCYLATRRGGHESEWDLTWVYAGKPVIERGEAGAFDKDILHVAASPVTHDDRHWIYYTGWPNGHMRHPYLPAIGLATVPLDRFVFVEPWKESSPGWIITKPFVWKGNGLELNADVQEGRIKAEILDARANRLAGYVGHVERKDGVRLDIEWHDKATDLAKLQGKTVRLKFTLNRARLFAFQLHADVR
jgi:hypothetical protein